MKRYLGISFVCVFGSLLLAGLALAKQPVVERQLIETPSEYVDTVGDVNGAVPVSKAMEDTVWIADWTFDGAGCVSTGWTKQDARIANDGTNYWVVGTRYASYRYGGPSGPIIITGKSAYLTKHDLCWEDPAHEGYGNDWDYSIICKYKGKSRMSFRYLCDSESGYDFLYVETDSACKSNDLVDYAARPNKSPVEYRKMARNVATGLVVAPDTCVGCERFTWCDTVLLKDYTLPTVEHCAYIRFSADGGWSPEDGLNPTTIGSGCVVDSIVVAQETVTDPAYNYLETFEGAINSKITLVNSANAKPFGEWARVYQHITDNDKCTEDITCAWLWTDLGTPANDASVDYGPGKAVIKNWLDDRIFSPWVSLASTPTALGTVIAMRRFPGNAMASSKILQNWSVRGRTKVDNTDSAAPGDSIDCVFPWGHSSSWNSLGTFRWVSSAWDCSANLNPLSRDIQMRLRVSDWQLVTGDGPPTPFMPGPGPFNDRLRFGRRSLSGPVMAEGIDSRYQGQDCFNTVANAIPGWAPGHPHVSPGIDRFGTCAFSMGTELTINKSGPNLVTGDSVLIQVKDVRNMGGIASVTWRGAITEGPHAGKAPPPYAVSGGFFTVIPDSVRSGLAGTLVPYWYFVTLDDQYFRGGDVLKYYWTATDNGGTPGTSYDPSFGPTPHVPVSVADAEAQSGGLIEVNFLPTIRWSATYLARIAADSDFPVGTGGKLTPTAEELAASHQKNCILYYEQGLNSGRRSTDLNRTQFMFTLDSMGYRGKYDVYDCQGYGNTNNQLGGRASQDHVTEYSLIVHDNGRNTTTTMPDGANLDTEKVNQAGWYQTWLSLGDPSVADTHTLWLIGENTLQEKPTLALFNTDMGVTLATANVTAAGLFPQVIGQVNPFTWANTNVSNFTTADDRFSLAGGCPVIRNYDGLNANAPAVRTHRYSSCTLLAEGAIVMKANAANHWNTIYSSFGWFDIREAQGCGVGKPSSITADPSPQPEVVLLGKVLAGCLADHNEEGTCGQQPNVVDTDQNGLPRVTSLRQNVPNPFNPTTKIDFDLARSSQVKLRVFDVAGHLVRVLANDNRKAGRYSVIWNGQDGAGRRVSSGVYFYQLVTDDLTQTKKMVVLK